MKLSTFFLISFIFFGALTSNAQTVGTWRIHEGSEGVIPFNSSFNGNPEAYRLATIPASTDAGWKTAPLDQNGYVSMSRSSTVKCKQEVDFTYFEINVNIPANTMVTDFKVSYDNADDGARIYLFNQSFLGGTFDPNSDLVGKGAKFSSHNLKDKVVRGDNRIVVVQFDDCANQNNISGIRVEVNGREIAPTVPTAPTQGRTGGTNILNVYEHINYGGKVKSFGLGDYDITETEFNDLISSVKILNGYKVTLFADWRFTGTPLVLTADTPTLENLNFNDFTSSIRVERK
ncbi:MAG: hypothetical protein IPI59_01660 [Sphingobacteriales bacterium]|jgi:hypothetical protein|nr:hypothetical protein [Sphingobacteriales bacterium]MBP9142423.1 hypothetical protein [Chitinophagales bacterium]MDA0199474.1 hypothetical protein [Bacteroidota bacterium]MBK6890671.1 hypothetical protein [Sphingobacteriales bacterium]MBK7526277.1 hypothetical protein [Sphingobacteriales bacterium]